MSHNKLSRLFNFNGLPPSQGLVSAWNLSDVNDAFGTNHLTNNGGTAFGAGKINNCAIFDGVDDYLSIADNAFLSIGTGNKLSICGWFNLDTLPGAGNSRTIVSKWDTAGNQREYIIKISDAGLLGFAVSNDGTAVSIVEHTTVININTWYFFTCWLDSAKIYLELNNDGVIFSAAHLADVIFDGTSSFRIGNRQEAGSHLFDGKIDAIRLYKDAEFILNKSLRATLYNNGKGREYVVSNIVASDEVNRELDQIINALTGQLTDIGIETIVTDTNSAWSINQNGDGPIMQCIGGNGLIAAEITNTGKIKLGQSGLLLLHPGVPGDLGLIENLNVDLWQSLHASDIVQINSYLEFCDSAFFNGTPNINTSQIIPIQGTILIALKIKHNGSPSSNAITIVQVFAGNTLLDSITLNGTSTAITEKIVNATVLTVNRLRFTISQIAGTTPHSNITVSAITKVVATP